jgi:hypothetical protein
MNAAEQARSIELATKIAAIVNLFKQQFTDVRADLSPWTNDPDTRELVDPDSIDISFSFPGISKLVRSRCVLVQIRFHEQHLIGVEASGFGHQGKQWTISTVDNWQFIGSYLPTDEFADKLKNFCRQVFELFHVSHSSD